MPDGLPSIVGRYRIVRSLGHGRLGALYVAEDVRIGRKAALRLLPMVSGELRTRLELELKSLARVQHSGLATIFDIGEHDGCLFFTRAFIQGRTLREIIAAKTSIPLDRRLQWMESICAALAYAHEHWITARSIKPSDIIVTDRGHLTLVDTGLRRVARMLHDELLGLTAWALDDPSYSSPEEVRGLETDQRSDIFAAGALFYELLTFERAFSGESDFATVVRILDGASSIRTDGLAPEVTGIIHRALESDPVDRYQTFDELGAELKRVRVQLASETPVPASMGVDSAPASPGSSPEPHSSREIIARRRVRSRRIEEHLVEAEAALAQNEYEQALSIAEQAALLDPDSGRVHELIDRIQGAMEAARARRVDDNVRFTVYRPAVMAPLRPYPLLFFTHLGGFRPDATSGEPDPTVRVETEAADKLGSAVKSFERVIQDAGMRIPHEALLQITPSVPGLQFNPPQYAFLWLDSFHRIDFSVRASPSLDGRVARGTIDVRIGAIPVAVVTVVIPVDARAPLELPAERDEVRPYWRIFASYSHKDTAIVRQFETYARGIGDSYMRDLVDLRAGEIWDDRLLEMIDTADVFQLFWSKNSMRSPFVRREWEHALTVNKSNFVRPLYWESPLPEDDGLPPPALKAIQFASVAVPDVPEFRGHDESRRRERVRFEEQHIEAERRREREQFERREREQRAEEALRAAEEARAREQERQRREQAQRQDAATRAEEARRAAEEARAREEERRRRDEAERMEAVRRTEEARLAAEEARRRIEKEAPPPAASATSPLRVPSVPSEQRSTGPRRRRAGVRRRTPWVIAIVLLIAGAIGLVLARC